MSSERSAAHDCIDGKGRRLEYRSGQMLPAPGYKCTSGVLHAPCSRMANGQRQRWAPPQQGAFSRMLPPSFFLRFSEQTRAATRNRTGAGRSRSRTRYPRGHGCTVRQRADKQMCACTTVPSTHAACQVVLGAALTDRHERPGERRTFERATCAAPATAGGRDVCGAGDSRRA